MERLTEKTKDGKWYISGLDEVSNRYLRGYGRVQIGLAIDKLARYETAEEDGRMVLLPCKPGDTVYVPHRGRIQEMTVTSARIDKFGFWFFEWKVKDDKGVYPWLYGFSSEMVGKIVFMTEQEAKEALEGMKK